MALRVKKIDLKAEDNAREHNTDSFELVYVYPNTPVLRRGQRFKLEIEFENRAFDQNKDKITLLFGLGPNPDVTKDTLIGVSVNQYLQHQQQQQSEKDKWLGRIVQQIGSVVEIDVTAAANAPFGLYTIQVVCQNSGYTTRYKHEVNMWLLFNPWCKDDLVYMPDPKYLDEYILCDVGKIWLGPYTTTRGREWAYGQFGRHILPACAFMFDRARVPYQHRGDPIRIARAISKIVNSNDDHGVLVGRWDGNYGDGIAPSAWPGSSEILEQFLTTKEEVRYGQCWVFAGVVTTVCRAIGVPCRPVSNLVSAHDSNLSLTVDKYYDEDNNELGGDPNNPMSEDSVWNYHVWNDIYMARPDLPKGYGGWQAIDATPQETSDGFYQCGPASVEAIRRGKVGLNYDVPFLISSVNADYVKWKRDQTCVLGYKKIFCNINHIGKMILTKKPFLFDPNGDKDRQDITNQYKHAEGTQEERLALYNAARNTRNAKMYFDIPDEIKEDVKFELADLDKIFIGDPIKTVVKLQNTSNQKRTIEMALSAASVYYTGNRANIVKKLSGQIKLEPKSNRNVHMQIKAEEYIDGLVEYNNMKIYAICTVVETKQTWGAEDDFQIVKPTIKIEACSEVKVGTKQNVSLQFDNPLPHAITGGLFRLSCPKILARAVPIRVGNVEPKSQVNAKYEIPIRKPGQFTIIATFASRELDDITGSAQFESL